MTFHQYINPTHGIPHGQTSRIESMLQSEREALRGFAVGSSDAKAARTNIEALEAALERSRNGDAIRAQRQKELQAESDRKQAERQAEAEAQLKERIRLDFRSGNPSASDADFERLYPALKDQHLVRQSEEAHARARRSIGRIL
jgi:hypothetical protein